MISTGDLQILEAGFSGALEKSKTMQIATEEHVLGMEDEKPVRGWRFYGSFGSLCLATFIIAIDATIISVALPVRTFSARPHEIPPPHTPSLA